MFLLNNNRNGIMHKTYIRRFFMRSVFPVKLENGTTIHGNEESFLISRDDDFIGVKGNDAKGSRFTNIVGFDGESLLKKCTNCGEVKPSAEGFGAEGRCTNSKTGMRRDQAQCKQCRAKKK